MPSHFPWHPDSWEWTQLPWWKPGDPCHELIIYYDGSCRHDSGEQSAGCAIAAFVQASGYWYFAGAVSTQLSPQTTSYVAELASAVLAHKLAFDLLKVVCCSQPYIPWVEFRFDSLTVGHQADGSWQIWSQPRMGQFLRSLHRSIESRFGVNLRHQHIKAHAGEPGNELVDCLAYRAAAGEALHDFQPWLKCVSGQEFVNAADWVWYLFRSDLCWEGHKVIFPAGPATVPDTGVFPAQLVQEVSCEGESQGDLSLKLATCNVLSLKPGKAGSNPENVYLTVGPSRQDSLLAQFEEEGVHIFAWQETRLRRASNRHDERYWLFRSPANEHGHYGILIGIHRILPIGTIAIRNKHSDVFIHEHEIAVVAATPRLMILRIKNPLLRCLVIAGHAPHTGAEPEAIRDWWNSVALAIPATYSDWHCILLVDANARIGAEPSVHVGDHQAEAIDPKAEGFLDFLSSHGLWVPATFSEFHTGLGATWRHARGQWFRNDFVCIPLEWQPFWCQSWISDIVDAGLVKEDHRAPVVHVRCKVRPYGQTRKPFAWKLRLEEIDRAALDHVRQPGWTVDVHSHAAALQDSLVECLWPYRVKPVRRPIKTTMTESTWQLVQEKRECRNLLHERSTTQRGTLLQAWFLCWKHARYECPLSSVHSAFDDLLAEQDRLIAISLREFRRLGTAVTKALKEDDIQFFTSLLSDCKDFLQPADVKHLWRIVRRSLPKYRQRRMNSAPFQLETLEGQWLPHYEELEAGVQVSPDELVQECVRTQALRRLDAPLALQINDLPSLTNLESACGAIQSDKATGYDPIPSAFVHQASSQIAGIYHDLIMKEFLWQCEPIQSKGGPVAILPKTLHPTTAKQFRGILLLPNIGKRAHAILRSHILRSLTPARTPGQLGGFPGQQVLYGSHALRTFGTICDSKGLCSALLFLDLSSAFHHLIREAVVGATDGANLEPVLRVLRNGGNSVECFQCFNQLPGILAELGVSEPIVRLLRDIHVGTRCTLHERWLLRTHRGTRPGSPLADIIFHALMARITGAIDQWLQDREDLKRVFAELDIEIPTVVWADDIAVPLATKAADALVPLLQSTLTMIRQTLQSYGFLLNFAKGKTSAVLTFRGPGAGEFRKKYQLHTRPGVMCEFPDGVEEWLHFVPAYRHLGTLFASSHDLTCELRARVGMAKAALTQLSRPILANKNLPVRLRLQFFHSLVATKLFFGLGSWPTPTPKQLQYFQGCYISMLRRVLKVGHQPLPAEQILVLAGTAEVRARLAVERLLYAQRLFRTGPAFLHMLLHREHACLEGSWLHGLFADLAWMEAVCPQCLPKQWQSDLTPLFDLWQDPRSAWSCLVKKCLKIHLEQNAIIADAKKLHGDTFRTLRLAGATFNQPPESWADLGDTHTCFCGRSFGTNRGLLAHQRKTHQIFSFERPFLHGCTCLHCGKFLWSTQRLQQHLAYIPKRLGYNPCYFALVEQGRQVDYAKEDASLKPQFSGLSRREALQAEGPAVNPATLTEQRRGALQVELNACFDRLHIQVAPEDEMITGEALGVALERVTRQWFLDHYPQGPSEAEKALLPDAWVEVLFSCPAAFERELDPWLEKVFLLWGEHWLPDVIATFEDGVAEFDVEELFVDFAAQLDRFKVLSRIAHLEAGLKACLPTEPTPHRTANKIEGKLKHPKTNSKTQQTVGRIFADQYSWQSRIRSLSFLDLPCEQNVPKLQLPDGSYAFLVIHLFSGRRREKDVHAYLHELGANEGMQMLVLSMDTAVSQEFGNLALNAASWKALLQLYHAGVVAATLVGSPCETFSEARFYSLPPDDEGKVRSGPRPLRSAEALFGLEGLSLRELKQCHTGGNFFQQAAFVLSLHMAFGGCFVSEHPAQPRDPSRPSVWTSALIEVLRRHPAVRLWLTLANISGWRQLSNPRGCWALPCLTSAVICIYMLTGMPPDLARLPSDESHAAVSKQPNIKNIHPSFVKGSRTQLYSFWPGQSAGVMCAPHHLWQLNCRSGSRERPGLARHFTVTPGCLISKSCLRCIFFLICN